MREIKFRAWNDKLKKMAYDFSLSEKGKVIEWWDGEYDGELDWPVMQFTGLYDSNGKEIFEGDIVRGAIDCGPAGSVEATWVVAWTGDGYQSSYWCKDLQFMIIGNIHENPELLEPPGASS
jgi:uncharacterized phage protein (TIGR01671 family)